MAESMTATKRESSTAGRIAIGLDEEQRSAMISLLNTLLSDESLLYVKTRSSHWNITGPHFNHLHQFLEGQYTELAGMIDEIAERVRAVGGTAMGTLKEYLDSSRLNESRTPAKAMDMVNSLLENHEEIIRHLRKDLEKAEELGDMGTSDFLTGLMQQHEKMAWMLRATAQQ